MWSHTHLFKCSYLSGTSKNRGPILHVSDEDLKWMNISILHRWSTELCKTARGEAGMI